MTTVIKQSIIHQQIALNDKMLEGGYITKNVHEKSYKTLVETLINNGD